jgi:hypothetical protein
LFHRIFFGAFKRESRPREWYAGLMHFFIFTGFGILLLGAFLDALSHYTIPFLTGNLYLAYSLVTDSFGILAIIGIGMAILRRYILRPVRLESKFDDLVVLALIFLTIMTGFFIEGLRIAATEFTVHPEWALWSPGGYLLSFAFQDMPLAVIRAGISDSGGSIRFLPSVQLHIWLSSIPACSI